MTRLPRVGPPTTCCEMLLNSSFSFSWQEEGHGRQVLEQLFDIVLTTRLCEWMEQWSMCFVYGVGQMNLENVGGFFIFWPWWDFYLLGIETF